MIALVYRDSLPENVAQELDQLVQGTTGWGYTEHNPEGGHTNITADSLLLNAPSVTNGITGDITFQDANGRKVVIGRSTALGTFITLMNAQAILIQATNAQGVVTQLLSLGFITMGPLTRAGIEFFPTIPNDPSVERDWAIVSGPASFSPAASLLVLDKSAGVSPVSLRWRQAVPAWEWMKTVGSLGPTTEKVTLGSGFDSSLQGYWDEAYLKRISMETKAGNTAFAGEWTDVPYNTANYSGSGSLVWTPTSSADQISYAYEITGQKMTLIFEVQGILTGADSSDLRLAVPGGYVVGSRASSNHAAWAIDNNDATNPEVAIKANPGLGYVSLQKSTSGHLTNWVAGGNLAYVQGEIILSIA